MELIGRQGRKKSDSGNTVSMKNIYALKGNGSRGQKGGENSKAGILSRKIIGFVKRDIPMVNSCWPLMTFLSFLCLEMVSRMNYSITLPGTDTMLLFPGSSFLPSVKTGVTLAVLWFLQSPQPFKDCQEQSHDDINEVPPYLWIHPIQAHGFIFVQLP